MFATVRYIYDSTHLAYRTSGNSLSKAFTHPPNNLNRNIDRDRYKVPADGRCDIWKSDRVDVTQENEYGNNKLWTSIWCVWWQSFATIRCPTSIDMWSLVTQCELWNQTSLIIATSHVSVNKQSKLFESGYSHTSHSDHKSPSLKHAAVFWPWIRATSITLQSLSQHQNQDS